MGDAATKGAVQAWTRSIARARAADNITANAFAPGVGTPGADRLRDFFGPDAAQSLGQQLKAMIPLGGLGNPLRDLGPMLVFPAVRAPASSPAGFSPSTAVSSCGSTCAARPSAPATSR